MPSSTITTCVLAAIAVAITQSHVSADVVGYTEFDEWATAVGQFTTIDFTGHNNFTVITDHYRDLGVNFSDGNDFIHHTPAFLNDGVGLHGNWADLQITIQFDEPQLWIGLDHPGWAAMEIYEGEQLIHLFENFGGGSGRFTGVVSDVPFDRVVVHRGFDMTPPLIDDLHFGIPAPGAIAVLALAGLLGTGSRRRRG